ncbi:MAG: hypothetical protein HY913_04450 [Desulfomonile tiedjei]|nr:hypothetical protein [Desulfomonile tiedjei]
MAQWQILCPYEGSDLDIDGYVRNIIGGAVKAATRIDQDQEGYASRPAGVHRFRFASQTELLWFKYDQQTSVSKTVVCDSTTENLNVLPGWSFKFREWTQPGDEFLAVIGGLFDGSAPIRTLSYESRVSGFPDSEKAFRVKNISGETQTNCSLVATNAVRVENAAAHPSKPFLCFYQSGSSNPITDGDVNGLQVTFDNWTDGTPPTVDILIAGDSVGILDVAANSLIPYGTRLKCDGTTLYRFANGTKWQSGTFILSPDLEESDTALIFVSDGGDQVELAQATGAFTRGANGIELTQTGQATGTVLNDGAVSVRLRLNPRVGLNSSLNPRSFSLRPVGTKGAADTSRDYQGTFWIEDLDVQKNLIWRIQALLERYKLPRYSPNPNPPPAYIPDPNGLHIEDPQNPGAHILASGTPSQGHYESIEEILSANGVTFSGG